MAEHTITLNDEEQMQADIICTGIARGESLVHVLSKEGMPEYHVVRNWLKHCENFIADFKLAKRDQAEYIYAEIQNIEWKMKQPQYLQVKVQMQRVNPDGTKKRGRKSKEQLTEMQTQANPDYLSSAVGQALIRSLQWRAERMNPESYGVNKKQEDVDDGSLGDEILAARKRVGIRDDQK